MNWDASSTGWKASLPNKAMFSLTLHSDPYLADKCPFSRKKRGESRCTPVNYHSHGKAAMLMEFARNNWEFPITILLPEIILHPCRPFTENMWQYGHHWGSELSTIHLNHWKRLDCKDATLIWTLDHKGVESRLKNYEKAAGRSEKNTWSICKKICSKINHFHQAGVIIKQYLKPPSTIL